MHFFVLLASVCSAGASHILPLERQPVSFEGAGSSALLKWIVMYIWQTLVMRLANGYFKKEMLEIRVELIRSHFQGPNSTLSALPYKLCFPFHYQLSYSSCTLIFCYRCGLRDTNETGKANDRWLLLFLTFFRNLPDYVPTCTALFTRVIANLLLFFLAETSEKTKVWRLRQPNLAAVIRLAHYQIFCYWFSESC